MTNFTPEMTEKAKADFDRLNTKSGELSDDELDNVAGGITDEWYYIYDPSPGEPNHSIYTEPKPTVVIGHVEHFCPHCIKVTVFHIPEQGADYCSVCNNVYDGPVVD